MNYQLSPELHRARVFYARDMVEVLREVTRFLIENGLRENVESLTFERGGWGMEREQAATLTYCRPDAWGDA